MDENFPARAIMRIFIVLALASSPLVSAAAPNRASEAAERVTRMERFARPLVWIGEHPPAEEETAVLAEITEGLQGAPMRRALEEFAIRRPNSPWTLSVRAQSAAMNRAEGRYTRALQDFESVWADTKHHHEGSGKHLADFALANKAQLLASLGRMSELKSLLADTVGRSLVDLELQAIFSQAKEGYYTMLDRPEVAFRCGTYALINVGQALGRTNGDLVTLMDVPSSTNGFTLRQLSDLAAQYKIGLVGVLRPPGAELVIPSVVHWRQDHYAAVVAREGSSVLVKDPTFGFPRWIQLSVVEEEASGHFLVPAGSAPQGWSRLTEREMSAVHGKGQPNNIDDWKDEGCDKSPGGAGAKKNEGCPPCVGMPVWWVTEPYINLWISDEPVGYTTSTGERMALKWTHRQRHAPPMDQSLRPTRSARTTNTVWTHSWLSHIKFRDPHWDTHFSPQHGITPLGYAKFTKWEATVYLPDGGIRMYNQDSASESRSGIRLERLRLTNVVQNVPAQGVQVCDYAETNGFKIVYPDGSEDRYNLLSSVPQTLTSTEAYLTQKVDRNGRVTTACYEEASGAGYSMLRIASLTDYDGRITTLRYNTVFPHMVREVEDPYGRKAVFQFYPAHLPSAGLILSITDAEQNQTSFSYGGFNNTNATVSQMVTPYRIDVL